MGSDLSFPWSDFPGARRILDSCLCQIWLFCVGRRSMGSVHFVFVELSWPVFLIAC